MRLRSGKRQSAKESNRPDGQQANQPEDRRPARPQLELATREEVAFLFRPGGLIDITTPGHARPRWLEISISYDGSIAFACLGTWGKLRPELISFSYRKH